MPGDRNPASPTDAKRSSRLDEGPPLPKEATKKRTLMDSASDDDGLGKHAGNPQVMAIRGMQMAERGMQLIAAGAPALADLMVSSIAQLRQLVPQAMSNSMGGGMPPTQATMPAAAMPVSAPPPPGPQGPPPGAAAAPTQ